MESSLGFFHKFLAHIFKLALDFIFSQFLNKTLHINRSFFCGLSSLQKTLKKEKKKQILDLEKPRIELKIFLMLCKYEK